MNAAANTATVIILFCAAYVAFYEIFIAKKVADKKLTTEESARATDRQEYVSVASALRDENARLMRAAGETASASLSAREAANAAAASAKRKGLSYQVLIQGIAGGSTGERAAEVAQSVFDWVDDTAAELSDADPSAATVFGPSGDADSGVRSEILSRAAGASLMNYWRGRMGSLDDIIGRK